MNKIVLNIGLLIFFISIIFFSQRGIGLQDTLIRSLVIFVVSTIMLGLLVLIFVKSINKASISKQSSFSEQIDRTEKP